MVDRRRQPGLGLVGPPRGGLHCIAVTPAPVTAAGVVEGGGGGSGRSAAGIDHGATGLPGGGLGPSQSVGPVGWQ